MCLSMYVRLTHTIKIIYLLTYFCGSFVIYQEPEAIAKPLLYALTMFSALAAVCTVDCAIEIVLITLHYVGQEAC